MVGAPSFTVSPPHINHGPTGDRAEQNVVQYSGEVIETDVDAHRVQELRLKVGTQPLPDGASSLDRVLDRVDPDERHGTKHERHDSGGKVHTTSQAAGSDGASVFDAGQHVGQRAPAD